MPANPSTPEVTRALKPCPKCDDVGELRTSRDGEVEWVRCNLCGHEGPLGYSTTEAVSGWNDGRTRTATPARGGDELREAVEREIAGLKGADSPWAVGIRDRLSAALASTDMAGAETPNAIETAPTDGTMIRLLVDYTDGGAPLEDEHPQSWTIGFNNLGNTGEDRWQFVGWSWTHDHFCEGSGKPVGWLPWSNPATGGDDQ